MSALYVMIPVALILVAIAVRLFFWAVDSGQYDDLDSPAHSILFDDPLSHSKEVARQQETDHEQEAKEQSATQKPDEEKQNHV